MTDRRVREKREFRVLVVDDETLYAQAIGRELERRGIECDLAGTAAEALEWARSRRYQVILLDHRLPDDDGIRLIPVLLARQMTASLVMMTAYETINNAIQAIRQGAEDYIVKESDIGHIVRAVEDLRRRQDVEHVLEAEVKGEGGLLGRSPTIVRAQEQIRRVAGRRDTTVLITGETGTGKEVAARWLHELSTPAGTPFIPVDCVALPPPLVESLLFGHEKGAFTGADRTRNGAFFEAGEGTIFFDEIGDMDLSLQGKLLRVLETREFHRIGSVKPFPVQARIVAATNRELAVEVQQGRFRFDLYQRLSVFPVQLPPLRERGDDILLLARHFVRHFGRRMRMDVQPLSREVEERLLGYDYPGNVRELKNIIERAIIMMDGDTIEPRHLPERVLRRGLEAPASGSGPALPFGFVPGVDTLESLEAKMIRHALEQARGVKAEAARQLGISRFQLLRRLEKLGIK